MTLWLNRQLKSFKNHLKDLLQVQSDPSLLLSQKLSSKFQLKSDSLIKDLILLSTHFESNETRILKAIWLMIWLGEELMQMYIKQKTLKAGRTLHWKFIKMMNKCFKEEKLKSNYWSNSIKMISRRNDASSS